MTSRLKLRGEHVSEHGPAAGAGAAAGGGAEEQRPAGSGSALDSVTSHLPTKSVMKDVKCKNGERREEEGGGILKRLSSWKPKGHYLLTWRCPQWGRPRWCEDTGTFKT